MPADGTLAAITPAEISASLPRQRQLRNKLHASAAKATNNVLPAVMRGYSVWRWVVVYPDRLTVNYIID